MENDHSAATSVQRNTLGASGASGNDDLNIVTRLIEELTSTLQDSHRAVDELCKLADGVTLNGNSTESRNDTVCDIFGTGIAFLFAGSSINVRTLRPMQTLKLIICGCGTKFVISAREIF
jgi:hypothetical protein